MVSICVNNTCGSLINGLMSKEDGIVIRNLVMYLFHAFTVRDAYCKLTMKKSTK